MEKVRIELQNISKSYYSETAVTQALRKVNLTFSKGEFVAITGESGSGKSTLLNIIGGMDSFDEGEMLVDGSPTFQYDDEDWETYRRTKIGYVFQDYSLIGHYTALDNVMSALLIMGYEQKSAQETAMMYLEQVGLSGYETHRASELSSGQKQRLSIARALAKNTGIIVADEPTGNLDSETGSQIIRLLKQLSTDRLVIMVTHNYDQAEDYVTRKIRLHDGQIISDVLVNQEDEPDSEVTDPDPSDSADETADKNSVEKMDFRWQNKVAALFAFRNIKTQHGRALLFTAFLSIIAIASFLFIGELFLHGDDYSTRSYSQSAFYRQDSTRLAVKRADGKNITDDDVKKLASISNVTTVDSCDLANDINFYLDEGKDYKFQYGEHQRGSDNEIKVVSFLNNTRFMMSSGCITEDDLSAGRLPQARNEIVLYSTDKSVLDSEMTCYFTANNIWEQNEYYKTTIKVVGILKKETSQVYFSKDLCRMLSAHISSGELRIMDDYDQALKDYRQKRELVPIINDSLKGNEARLSDKMPSEYVVTGDVEYRWRENDENGEAFGEETKGFFNIDEIHFHDYTKGFIEVSQEFFDQYCKAEDPQASVYLSSYAKTDSVLRKLEKMGYEGVSTYRLSMTDYLEELVTQRLTVIGISVFGLLALLLAEILILRSLMKIRIKDYFVLKFIGMKMQVIRKISYFEMGGYTLFSILFTIILMWILRLAGVSIIQDIMWYYHIGTYLVFAAYNLILILLTVAAFNRLLKGRLNA